MTIQIDDRETNTYSPNGQIKSFPYDFPIFKGDNGQKGLEVRFIDDLGFTVVDPSEFTVIQNTENTGGVVQFYTAPISGKKIVIVGSTPIDQQLDITNYSRFNGESIETNFDKIIAILQELYMALSEEQRQRINNDKALKKHVDDEFKKIANDLIKRFDDKWEDISNYINSLLPYIMCIVRKETKSIVDPQFDEKWLEISEYLNNLLPYFFCIMKKEIEEYTKTKLIDDIQQMMPEHNGDLSFEVKSDTSVELKLKGSDGIVRKAILTLS